MAEIVKVRLKKRPPREFRKGCYCCRWTGYEQEIRFRRKRDLLRAPFDFSNDD
jgi:hypothetical protein